MDPNAEEFGQLQDFRSFNYNMYWSLLNMYSENFGFGPGFFIRGTSNKRIREYVYIYTYIERERDVHVCIHTYICI